MSLKITTFTAVKANQAIHLQKTDLYLESIIDEWQQSQVLPVSRSLDETQGFIGGHHFHLLCSCNFRHLQLPNGQGFCRMWMVQKWRLRVFGAELNAQCMWLPNSIPSNFQQNLSHQPPTFLPWAGWTVGEPAGETAATCAHKVSSLETNWWSTAPQTYQLQQMNIYIYIIYIYIYRYKDKYT